MTERRGVTTVRTRYNIDDRCIMCEDLARYDITWSCQVGHYTTSGFCGEHISQKNPLPDNCLICGRKIMWILTDPELPGFLSFRSYDGTVFWIVPDRWTQEERLRT